MKKKYFLSMMLSFLVALGFITPISASSKEVKTDITQFRILNWTKKEASAIYETNNFYLSMDWDASAHGADLHEGDYFDITLPDQMIFPTDSSHTDFHLYANDGKTIIGNAHVTPYTSGGGKVRVTFTDYVNDRYNVKGNIYLAAHFDTKEIKVGEENTFEITVNGKVSSKTIKITGPTELKDEVLCKWGSNDKDPTRANWSMRINHSKRTLDDATLTDTLGDSGETYIKDSFKLYEVEFNAKGGIVSRKTVTTENKLSFSEDCSSFTLHLGKMEGTSYYLTYKSTYTPSTLLQNKATLKSEKGIWVHKAGYRSSDAGGNGDGDLTNKIKIIKVDANNGETRLKDATFVIKNVKTGKTYELTTDEDGEAISQKLVSGEYTIEETKAPTGYIKNDKVLTVNLNDGSAVIKTITNEAIKTSVKVTKKWNGEKKDSVTVNLLADGEKVKSVTLNEENKWTYTFDDIPEYKDGKKIEYTVEEEPVEGYTTEISGDQEEGYVITNTENFENGNENGPNTETGNNTGEVTTANETNKKAKHGKVSQSVAETGDHTEILFIEMLFIVSAGVLLFIYRKTKN